MPLIARSGERPGAGSRVLLRSIEKISRVIDERFLAHSMAAMAAPMAVVDT